MATTKEISRNLGGDRLGSGNKNNVTLHAYNRSTHDLSRTWRSSMNVGTLVPFMVELGLNGDSFSIDLDNIVRTLPSQGPLYGSYKLQLDVFECPIRLYNGLLHNNMTGIGLNMAQVKLPKITLRALVRNREKYNDNLNTSQISKSSLINYLGVNGVADFNFSHTVGDTYVVERNFNAVPLIAYYDIYKNYYANKQEGKGAMIMAYPHYVQVEAQKVQLSGQHVLDNVKLMTTTVTPSGITLTANEIYQTTTGGVLTNFLEVDTLTIKGFNGAVNTTNIKLVLFVATNSTYTSVTLANAAYETVLENNGDVTIKLNSTYANSNAFRLVGIILPKTQTILNQQTDINVFDLSDIDEMRIQILKDTGLNNELNVADVNVPLWQNLTDGTSDGNTLFKYGQHGLALKTYQSDLYNNWLKTEWIDGVAGINKITAIDTSSGSFEIDALILSKKIYNMLNRIAVSGGSFEDWQEAVYSVKALRRPETPVYRGGMSAEIMFSEVVSNAATEDDPLGTLAGKGGDHAKKGGKIEINCEEPCIIMGIVSITPRIDYSQGNSWIMTELDSMDDLHKPALDGIGFEDLLQERMAYWGTIMGQDQQGNVVTNKMAAGKVPAWINYMTAVNETHGDFAEEDKTMFMTLNRRYQYPTGNYGLTGQYGIADLTTYVDPAKYNYIFADASLEAQNFWVQIGIRMMSRRVMSAKIIPFA